jgi:hypothetical protein
MGTVSDFRKGKAAGPWSWPLTFILCRGQEWWNYAFTAPYVFMTWCLLIKHKDKFYLSYVFFQIWWKPPVSNFNKICGTFLWDVWRANTLFDISKSGFIVYKYGWKSELPNSSLCNPPRSNYIKICYWKSLFMVLFKIWINVAQRWNYAATIGKYLSCRILKKSVKRFMVYGSPFIFLCKVGFIMNQHDWKIKLPYSFQWKSSISHLKQISPTVHDNRSGSQIDRQMHRCGAHIQRCFLIFK